LNNKKKYNFVNMKTYASKDLIVEKQDIGYEVMDVDTEQRRVKAVWARTGNVDLDNDIIVPEAFKASSFALTGSSITLSFLSFFHL